MAFRSEPPPVRDEPDPGAPVRRPLDAAPFGFLSFTDDGQVVSVNATLGEWLGVEPGAVEGQSVESLLSPGARVFYQTHLFPVLRLQGAAEEIYLSFRSANGGDVPVLINARRQEREGGAICECAVMRISQRSQFENELLQARKTAQEASAAKSRFLSVMSHELRTPLQAITVLAGVLSRKIHGPLTDRQLEDLHGIQTATDTLSALIGDVLSFAQLEAGRVSVRVDTVSLETTLSRVESLLRARFEEAGLVYARGSSLSGVTVRADAERLQQIFLNLFTNAIKFTERGGRVTVETDRSGRRVDVRVRDTGVGIAPEDLERIFEPFVQVDPRRVGARQRGVGLGLAISRDLARAMGGDLTVDSRPDEGSTFTVALRSA